SIDVGDASYRCFHVFEVHQRGDVVGAAGFDAGADAAFAHAAERLAENDRAGRRPIDVQVAGADVALPDFLFAVVEAFEAGGKSVARGVCQVDRGVEIVGFHHGEHGAEEFGAVSDAAGLDAPFDARA